MTKLSHVFWTMILGIGVTFLACVTINIYFPAEKVESVAGEIVDEIRGQVPGKQDTQSRLRHKLLLKIRLALSPATAWADEVTSVSNPTIRALKAKMKSRFQQLKPFYQKGVLKENSTGYLAVGSTSGLSLKEKRDVKRLVAAENSDRGILYQEVAKALNIDAGQINRVAGIFAKEWQKPVR